MRFKLVDYSQGFYGERVPCERRGKFIQVRNANKEYLVLAPGELCQYHANIAERFFEDMGIAGVYNDKRDSFRIEHPAWTIVGGGSWSADDSKLRLKLSGQSLAYGRFDRKGLARRLQKTDGFSAYTIEVTV
jgi:hypothetical protein